MKFYLLDRIESITATRVVADKQVSLAEEYLADHFPTFPVLPGVMMLEAATQAAAWLLHRSTDFRCSMAVLREARNVKYGRFVAPGDTLRVDVEALKPTDTGMAFRATGTVVDAGTDGGPGGQAVAARIELAYFNLAERAPELADVDRRLVEHHRRRWAALTARADDLGL